MASHEDAEATRRHEELVEYAKRAVAAEHGLSETQSKRLVGTTLGELHDDARAMAKELGVRDPSVQTRDQNGRYAVDMNVAIRQASGR